MTWLERICCVIIAVLLLAVVVVAIYQYRECTIGGGVLVRGVFANECIRR